MDGLGAAVARAFRARRNPLAAGTMWMTGGQGARIAGQAVYFVLIARVLGPHDFGVLAASLAIVYMFFPFAGLGAGNLLIRDVANSAGVTEQFRRASGALGATLPVLGAATVGIFAIAFPRQPAVVALCIAVSELLFARFVDIVGQTFQATDRLSLTAVAVALPSLFRALAAIAFTSAGFSGVTSWAVWYLTASASAAAAAACVVVREFGFDVMIPQLSVTRARVVDGFYFATGQASGLIYADIDKVLLGRMVSLDVAGVYAAAYRAMSFAFIPILSLLFATYARFFRVGSGGAQATMRFALRLSPVVLVYAALTVPMIFAGAEAMPFVLGSKYAATAHVLRWLALLPLLQALYYLPGDALSGAGSQRLRSLLQLGAAVTNTVLNVLLIPTYSWKGAVLATYVAVGGLAIALWLSLIRTSRAEAAEHRTAAVAA